jgi:hypothetical protein
VPRRRWSAPARPGTIKAVAKSGRTPVALDRWLQKAKQTAADRREAIRFLTDATGPWAEACEGWCDMANIDPDIVRKWALAMLAQLRVERFGHVRVRTRVRPVPSLSYGQSAAELAVAL